MNEGLRLRVATDLLFANLETRHLAGNGGAVAGQGGVVLWNELGDGVCVDGRAANRLPNA